MWHTCWIGQNLRMFDRVSPITTPADTGRQSNVAGKLGQFSCRDEIECTFKAAVHVLYQPYVFQRAEL